MVRRLSRAIALLALAAAGQAMAQSQTSPVSTVPPASTVGATLMAPGVPVQDLERSLAFYRIALGLVPGTTLHHGSLTEAMLCADSPSGRLTLILLHDGREPSAHAASDSRAKIVLRVPDLAGVAGRMRAAGYPVDAIGGGDNGHPPVLMIADPDGHRLELVGNPTRVPRPGN